MLQINKALSAISDQQHRIGYLNSGVPTKNLVFPLAARQVVKDFSLEGMKPDSAELTLVSKKNQPEVYEVAFGKGDITKLKIIKLGVAVLPFKEIRLTSGHLRYQVYDNNNSEDAYNVVCYQGKWLFESSTSPAVSPLMRRIFPKDLIDNGINSNNLSGMDKSGVQWDKENNCYLKIDNGFAKLDLSHVALNRYYVTRDDTTVTLTFDGRRFQIVGIDNASSFSLDEAKMATNLRLRNKDVYNTLKSRVVTSEEINSGDPNSPLIIKTYRDLKTKSPYILYTFMNGLSVPIKEVSSYNNNVNYAAYNIRNEEEIYPIRLDDKKSFVFELKTSSHISHKIGKFLSDSMYAKGISFRDLLSPNELGMQRDKNGNEYIKINNRYVRLNRRIDGSFYISDGAKVIELKLDRGIIDVEIAINVPPTTPITIAFHVDFRGIDDIKTAGGMLPFVASEDTPVDDRISSVFTGQVAKGHRTNFVSTSAELEKVIDFANTKAIELAEKDVSIKERRSESESSVVSNDEADLVEVDSDYENFDDYLENDNKIDENFTMYVYQIAPNNNYYDVNASIERSIDYFKRKFDNEKNDSDRAKIGKNLFELQDRLNRFGDMREWASNGGVSLSNIKAYAKLTGKMINEYYDLLESHMGKVDKIPKNKNIFLEEYWVDKWQMSGLNHMRSLQGLSNHEPYPRAR